MGPAPYVVASPPVPSVSVFREGIFAGKVLFCTGGGTGIGRAMTEAVLRHGADAVIVSRNIERNTKAAEELAHLTGRTVLAAQADVRDPTQLADAVARTIAKFGRIDFVVCGAAGNFLAPVGELSENAFKAVIAIDVLGTFNTVKATLPHVRASRGAYLHIGVSIHYRGIQLQSHVSAAKAALDKLSAVLAVEEGPRGVRSNVLTPGPIGGTVGIDRIFNKAATTNQRAGKSIPLQRMGHPGDVGNATVFLLSDAAAYISGQILIVDGGNRHTSSSSFPYPDTVLDPKARL